MTACADSDRRQGWATDYIPYCINMWHGRLMLVIDLDNASFIDLNVGIF